MNKSDKRGDSKVLREGPTLITHEGKDKLNYPYTICSGCKHFAVIDFQYPYCAAQPCDPNRAFPNPKFGANTRNYGAPNVDCPYPHTGRPRTALQILDVVTAKDSGWSEECPDANTWYFKKKNWLMTFSWIGQRIRFTRLQKVLDA